VIHSYSDIMQIIDKLLMSIFLCMSKVVYTQPAEVYACLCTHALLMLAM